MANLNERELAQEFLESMEERAKRSFQGKLHQAFIDWYVEAEFGRAKWSFTDGPGDRGIDAIVWRPESNPAVVIIQSKFSTAFGKSRLAGSAYDELQRVVRAFRYGGDEFAALLDGAAAELAQLYRRAQQLTATGGWWQGKKAFRLITTHRRAPNLEFDDIPPENFVNWREILDLYRRYRRDWAPKAHDLSLQLGKTLAYRDPARGTNSYLFNAAVADFRKYLNRHPDVGRLVARNIRFRLKGPVGRTIQQTYEKNPSDFWYLHNGITIVCDEFRNRNGTAVLRNPSVINGAQTLYAINRSQRDEPGAMVGTRVIVRGDGADRPADDDAWLQRVIRGVNTQNHVRAYDLRSNEPEQVTLQILFRDQGVFYERKRGEWAERKIEPQSKGLRPLSLRRLGQILMTVSGPDGGGVITAKGGVEEIFAGRHYADLFPASRRIRKRFADIYAAYRLFKLLRDNGYPSPAKRLPQRHAFWNCLWLLHRGVWREGGVDIRNAHRLQRAFDAIESSSHAKSAVRKVTRVAWATWKSARKRDPELSANNFFKVSAGNKRLLRSAYPKVRKDLRALAQELGKTP